MDVRESHGLGVFYKPPDPDCASVPRASIETWKDEQCDSLLPQSKPPVPAGEVGELLVVQQVIELDEESLGLDTPLDAVRIHVVPHQHPRVVDHV